MNSSITRNRRGATALLLVVLPQLQACDLDVSSRLGQHPEVAWATLLTDDSQEQTYVVLSPGGPHRVRVQLLDPAGLPITNLGPDHRTSLLLEPAETATIEPVAGDPFAYDVSLPLPCGRPRQAFVGYGHDIRADERIFGPIPVHVPPQISSARLFGPDSVELTPEVHLPSRQAVHVEVRFYDCDGAIIRGLEAEHEAILFFSTGDFASWTRVPDAVFQHEVFVFEPSGAVGQIALGISTIGETDIKLFGPFPLIVD